MVPPSRAVGAFHCRRDGLNPRRRCDSRHRFESLAARNAADVARILPRVDGFAVQHSSCFIVAELFFFGSATLPAAARHGAPPAAGAAADASGVAKHRRFHRQASWALFIVAVMGSFFADAATLATVARRSRYASMPTARVTVSPSARADSLARPRCLCARRATLVYGRGFRMSR